jgi:hypothetical protein
MAKTRKRYNKGKRVDMRQGGRVALAKGNLTTIEDINKNYREKMNTDPASIQSKEDLDKLSSGPLSAKQRSDIFNKFAPGLIPQPQQDFKKDPAPVNDPRPAPTSDPIPDSDKGPYGNYTVGGGTSGLTGPRPIPSSDDAPRGGKVVGGPRTPEELKQQEMLSYVAGRTPTVEAGDTMTDAQREAAERALQAAQGRGGGPGGQAGPWWRRAGFNSKEEAIAAGFDPNTGQQTTTTAATEAITGPYGIGLAQLPASMGVIGGRTPEQQQAVRELIEAGARGEIPKEMVAQTLIDAETGELPADQFAQRIDMLKTQGAQAFDVARPTEERVTEGVTTAAEQQARITAAQISEDELAIVSETPMIDDVTGALSSEAIAPLQDASLTIQARGVSVDEQQAVDALTQRVIGKLSPETKAEAAKVAGTDLPRVLRAKKQLRRAGLTEDQINLIGNDPELLEQELMNYTEEQRGMIAGLPDEALVSTQLNALLQGMEDGEIPAFARPAVAAVNQMLAARGMSASTVGQEALFNAIIQSAIPLAQSNAQSIKESVTQQRSIEAQAEQMNAQMRQQTALENASKVFNMDMAQFTADQQTALANSKFLQTVTLTDTSNEQNAILANATNMAKLDLAELDANTRLQAQNAQAFLQMDMANLSNRQQAETLRAQQQQQRLLSNQAARNAAANFNATSENQTNQFMASLAQQIEINNKQRMDAMQQFNASQANAAEARRVGNEAQANAIEAQMRAQVSQFNAQLDYNREQFNTQNALAVQQYNTAWRRDANKIDTAAINAANQFNAEKAFNMSAQSMSFLWQEMRDQMDYAFKAYDNDQQRKASLLVAALGNEGAISEEGGWASNLEGIGSLVSNFLGG